MVATAGVSLPTATTEAATAEAVTTVNLKAKAGLAIDAKTGQILYDKNSKQVLPAASMSKLLAIYIVLENIHSGKLKWDQKKLVSITRFIRWVKTRSCQMFRFVRTKPTQLRNCTKRPLFTQLTPLSQR